MSGDVLAYQGLLLYNQYMTEPGRIIIEFVHVGNVLKVCAVCERTGREVSFVGDPRASEAELHRLAVNKLKYVMRKEAEQRQAGKKGILA